MVSNLGYAYHLCIQNWKETEKIQQVLSASTACPWWWLVFLLWRDKGGVHADRLLAYLLDAKPKHYEFAYKSFSALVNFHAWFVSRQAALQNGHFFWSERLSRSWNAFFFLKEIDPHVRIKYYLSCVKRKLFCSCMCLTPKASINTH